MRKNRRDPFVGAVLATVRRRRLLGPGDVVLAAVSAGPDSTALVGVLAALRDLGAIAGVVALHVDHGLRPGVEGDAACAAEACSRLGVPFRSVAVRVGPGNVQAQARKARYEALLAEAARTGATRIATGHTQTDQAETVLLRLLRGAGARGLAAIPPRRGALVRPLIDRSRAEGIAFCARADLAWREDPTNATPRFARNRLRHSVWPALLELSPAAERALARTADLARADERALAARARFIAGSDGSVAVSSLRAEPLAVRRRVVRRLWKSAGGEGELEAKHVDAALTLSRRSRPGRVALPGGLEVRCRYGSLSMAPSPPPRAGPPADVPVPAPGRYDLPGGGAADVDARDPAAIPWPLTLRTRRPGDRFRPDGGAGAKKLKGWLIDRKVPREERDGLLVLAAGSEVVAVPALRKVARGFGPSGAGLTVRITPGR